MHQEEPSKNDDYCDYVKAIFDIYYIMLTKKNKSAHIHRDELNAFQRKFNNEELCFLLKRYLRRCLDLVYNTKNNELCSSQREQPKGSMQ